MLLQAIDKAFEYDNHVIVEEEVIGQEVEFAVLGNDVIKIPPPGELLTHGEFYDYDKKYGDNPIATTTNARIDATKLLEGYGFVTKIYRLLGCCGMARIDCFIDAYGKYYLNEVNTIPGFTNISLYPKIWENYGVNMTQLLNTLIALAIKRFSKEKIMK